MTDFVHTIPDDEYYFAHKKQLALSDSHGCIHVHPEDIDSIVKYIKIGSVIEIHPYSEMDIPVGFDRNYGRPPVELHFFPFIDSKRDKSTGNIVLYNVRKVTSIP